MRRGIIAAVLVVVGIPLGAIVAFFAYSTTEFTHFATFDAPESAERAVDKMHEAGFDAEEREGGQGRSVTFESGETGDDASEFLGTFHEVVEREGGKLGHPGGGCIERPPFI